MPTWPLTTSIWTSFPRTLSDPRAHLNCAQSRVPMNEHAPEELGWQCHSSHCSAGWPWDACFLPFSVPSSINLLPTTGPWACIHLHWLPHPCKKRCCGVMPQNNNYMEFLPWIMLLGVGRFQTKTEPNTASASLAATLCCWFILIFQSDELPTFFLLCQLLPKPQLPNAMPLLLTFLI